VVNSSGWLKFDGYAADTYWQAKWRAAAGGPLEEIKKAGKRVNDRWFGA
jgi:hypothetical protein